MGIQVEFNPDLALRDISEFKSGNRKIEECIPAKLEVNRIYSFLKYGQRNYWLKGEIPLLKTKENEKLSKPLASVVILECTHFKEDNELFTRGKFKVIEIFSDKNIHFNSYARI
ncbi:hypothetical protein KKF61_02575 [Patescibacteria group bacterium]|nr:hypothetical protein [Patescibacteria group bacterium]MBU0964637.1 hypothetical protein [Patescibacteria group bacterium]